MIKTIIKQMLKIILKKNKMYMRHDFILIIKSNFEFCKFLLIYFIIGFIISFYIKYISLRILVQLLF